MYDAGARIFVEVGPKRALTMFASQILEEKPHLAVMTNHPKQGGIASFLTSNWSTCARRTASRSLKEHRVCSAKHSVQVLLRHIVLKVFFHKQARKTAFEHLYQTEVGQVLHLFQHKPFLCRLRNNQRLPTTSVIGLPTAVTHPCSVKEWSIFDLVLVCRNNPLNIIAGISAEEQTDSEVDVQSATAADIERWVRQPPSGWSPRVHLSKSTPTTAVQTQSAHDPLVQRRADPYVVSGISLGLPGGEGSSMKMCLNILFVRETCIQGFR